MSAKKTLNCLVLSLLFIAVLACSVSYKPESQNGSEDQPGQPDQTGEEENGSVFDLPSLIKEVPTSPVGLNEGLSSLNTYTYSLQVITVGPTPQDRSDTKVITSTDTNNDRTMTRTESTISSADDPQGESSVSTNYRVGNVNCTVDNSGEGEAESEDYSAAAKEMVNILANLWDVHIKAENAVHAGTETISGINCNHFTFTVGGLGKTSGAEVTQSSGEYWSAVDGNYLVKYDVVLETRNAPESSADAEVLRSEMHYLLYDINGQVTIKLPAQCQ